MKLKSDKEMKDQFVIEVKNRFDGLVELIEAEELFEKMKESLNEVMADKVPKMQKKQHKKWMTEEILNLMENRRKAKSKIDLYKTLNTQIKDKCNEAKEQWINEQCKEIENNLTVDSKYMHSKIKDIKGTKGCTASNCIKAKDGNLLMEREDVLNRWSEYIEDLFQDDRGEKPMIKKDMDGPPILKEEVSAAIRKMKHGKAVGPDNIPIEVFAVLEDIGIDFLTKLLNSIYDSGKIPKDLAKSVFITLPKIPGTMDCELYRTISLMSQLTKVLLRIIMARMRKSLRPEISQLQFGFVPDKSTRNAIFTLSMLAERCIEMQKDLYLCFIDYSKAFDKVRHEKLFNILEHLDIDGKDLRVIRNLYWDQYDRGEKPIIKKDMDGPPILKEEVSAAIRKMKHGKAVGPDNIPIEVFAVLEDIGIDFLTKLLNSIYDSGKTPKDLAKSVFITLPKIPGTMDCELYRTISLMSQLTKVLLRIIMARMSKSLRPEISQLQFGFVPDKSTRNAIFTLSMLAERCIEMQKDLYLCFIDYSKAFDKVRHEKRFNILEHLDIDGKDLRVIRNLYWDQIAAVRIGGELSEYTLIKRGVRQGCVMSPDLFNIYSEMILRNLENYPGVKINGENINNIRYADDTVLIADSEENLQRLLDITIEKSEEMGLTLNVKKTECMVISKKAIVPSCNLQSRGQQIKLVKKFKYLGYMITSDGKCITEIKKRIATAKDAFQKLSLILKNRNISMTTKFRVLKTYVWSTLTYGCECWTITSDIEKKIEAAEMWFIRRMLRISWTEKETNVNVLREGNIQRSLLKTIRKRQMEFLGHVCRRRGLEFLSLTGKVEGKRDRGKQRITFLDSLCNSATGGQSKGLNFLKLSDDRDVWRGMVANVCSRSGT